MLINKDLMAIMRRGSWVMKQSQEKQNDAGFVVAGCMVLGIITIIISILVR